MLHARFGRLTAREREIMTHITAGLPNKQIAAETGLSEVTVKLQRGSVMKKMEAWSVADLVRMAEALRTRPLHSRARLSYGCRTVVGLSIMRTPGVSDNPESQAGVAIARDGDRFDR